MLSNAVYPDLSVATSNAGQGGEQQLLDHTRLPASNDLSPLFGSTPTTLVPATGIQELRPRAFAVLVFQFSDECRGLRTQGLTTF